MLAGAARNVFLVGDDDQTIYAWRLADVRRVLDLAASLPGLRRVDLVTNYRCPRPVVDRAVKLIAGNRERFAKTIQARPNAEGQLFLVPDAGDDVARARRLLREWAGHARACTPCWRGPMPSWRHTPLSRWRWASRTAPWTTACCWMTPDSTSCSAPTRTGRPTYRR